MPNGYLTNGYTSGSYPIELLRLSDSDCNSYRRFFLEVLIQTLVETLVRRIESKAFDSSEYNLTGGLNFRNSSAVRHWENEWAGDINARSCRTAYRLTVSVWRAMFVQRFLVKNRHFQRPIDSSDCYLPCGVTQFGNLSVVDEQVFSSFYFATLRFIWTPNFGAKMTKMISKFVIVQLRLANDLALPNLRWNTLLFD